MDGTTRAELLTPVTAAFVLLPLTDEFAHFLFDFMALSQRVRGARSRLELRGLLQQARDAFHFGFDCGAGDAPLVFAHGGVIARSKAESDATGDALLSWFCVAILYCYGIRGFPDGLWGYW